MIKLIPMEENDFQAYLQRAVGEYAQEQVKAGYWHPDEAQQKSKNEYQHLLPNGLATENQYIYTITDANTNEKIGIIWLAILTNRVTPVAFIYDFFINEQYRRKGYATQALKAIEERALELGTKRIGLHVFGHNQAARTLYEKTGYIIASLNMAKNL